MVVCLLHETIVRNHVWGDFLSKHPDEAMDFLNYVAETSKGWDKPNLREMERMRPSFNTMGGMYALSEEMVMKARIST